MDCGFKHAAMTIASKIDMDSLFCHDALCIIDYLAQIGFLSHLRIYSRF